MPTVSKSVWDGGGKLLKIIKSFVEELEIVDYLDDIRRQMF